MKEENVITRKKKKKTYPLKTKKKWTYFNQNPKSIKLILKYSLLLNTEKIIKEDV